MNDTENRSDVPEESPTLARLLVTRKVKLPDILDVLIVGAGPAGTAAAFRAKELGLSALVIDRDEILSILTDWMVPDEKPVDSSFGPGGRRVAFPTGGDLVAQLEFGDQIPSTQIYKKWMEVYLESAISAKPAMELVGLEPGDKGIWVATCLDQQSREQVKYFTRSVLLAMGRGVPTKLEMPGNTAGINYKLKGTSRYIGSPACVVGGGTSAAEAVIEISEAKVKAGDKTDVFWSYRRTSLPKVNSTLAPRFFKAYAGNGNIKYIPLSQSLAVLKGGDGAEFLALRCDRLEVPGRPPQGMYLEFPKDLVLACIGADLPVKFLAGLGIEMLEAADQEEKLMAVSPLMESAQPNVFLVGDVLSPAHIQTTNFSSDELQSTVIDHKGNFKQAMIDGVLVVEALHQRLHEGKADDAIVPFLEQRKEEFKRIHKERLERGKAAKEEAKAAPIDVKEKKPEPTRLGGAFTLLVDKDGEAKDGQEYFFPLGRIVIGHSQGDVSFPDDEGVVDEHVAILVEPDGCYVNSEGMQKDYESWVDIRTERTVPLNSVIAAGSQRLRVTQKDSETFLVVLDTNQQPKSFLPTSEEEKIYGKASSSITIDAADKMLSRRHFTFSARGSVFQLRDFGSLNHTFLKVFGAVRLNEGDIVVVGKKRLLFKNLETGAADTGAAARAAEPAPKVPVGRPTPAAGKPDATIPVAPVPAASPESPPAPVTSGEPGVMVLPVGEQLSIDGTKTLLEQFKERGLATKKRKEIGDRLQSLYSCGEGTCGQCILKVVSGNDLLSKMSGKEKKTLKNMVQALAEDQGRELTVEECRLACVTKAENQGAVRVELLGNTDE